MGCWSNRSEVSYAGKVLSALKSIIGGDKNSFGNQFLEKFSNDQINTRIQKSRTHYSPDIPQSQIVNKINKQEGVVKRIYTMPNDIQVKYNKLMNSKKWLEK